MQAGIGLLVSDMMPIYMIIALDIVMIIRFSINFPTAICLPIVCYFQEEASSENYGPRVYLPSYKFPIYNFSFLFTLFAIFTFQSIQQKYQKYLSYYLYQISLLQVAMKGLTTPLSRWLQGS